MRALLCVPDGGAAKSGWTPRRQNKVQSRNHGHVPFRHLHLPFTKISMEQKPKTSVFNLKKRFRRTPKSNKQSGPTLENAVSTSQIQPSISSNVATSGQADTITPDSGIQPISIRDDGITVESIPKTAEVSTEETQQSPGQSPPIPTPEPTETSKESISTHSWPN
jgi:hypothetical protein